MLHFIVDDVEALRGEVTCSATAGGVRARTQHSGASPVLSTHLNLLEIF